MAVLELGSKLSFQQTNEFVEAVTKTIEGGDHTIYIDMKDCQYLNSIMLSGLIRALKICEQNKGHLVLKKVNASTMTLFETTNVLNLFSIENEESIVKEDSTLELKFREESGKTGVFEIIGSINSNDQCSKFREFYQQYIIDIQNGILDCSKLFHLGSTGVNEMFRLRGILQEKAGKLYMMAPTDAVESVWKMMHLESLIPSIENPSNIKNRTDLPG